MRVEDMLSRRRDDAEAPIRLGLGRAPSVVVAPSMLRLLRTLGPEARAYGLTRQRTGVARGTSWLDLGGRTADGAWTDVHVKLRPMYARAEASVVSYQPLSRGGRTVVLGSWRLNYETTPDVVLTQLGEQVVEALGRLARLPVPIREF